MKIIKTKLFAKWAKSLLAYSDLKINELIREGSLLEIKNEYDY
jgi:hypothetical protein